MPFSEFKDIAAAINDLVAAAGVLAASVWAVWRFLLRGELYCKIQFDLDLQVISRARDHLVVEVVAIIENKGLRRHWLRDFTFDLSYLPVGAPIVDGDERNLRQVLFQPVGERRHWVQADPEDSTTWLSRIPFIGSGKRFKRKSGSIFVDDGTVRQFRYVASVPTEASMVLVRAQFQYPIAGKPLHQVERVFSVVPKEVRADSGGGAAGTASAQGAVGR